MCLKVKSPWDVPEETGQIGKLLPKENDPYRLIGDQLFERWDEEEFADLYSHEEKPGYPPVILAFANVFQFMERLADRQAAQTQCLTVHFEDFFTVLVFDPEVIADGE